MSPSFMKTKGLLALAALVSLAVAYPVRREVPQEHSHEATLRITNTFLKKNNPDNITDAVFALLGNAAAATGQGNFPDTNCLQAGTADRAFTNAKAEGSIEGQTHALIYRALERNTGSVGGVSAACVAFTPVNAEVAALQQHQDPASPGAAALNKAITLELARQIASVGGDPLDALQSGTFAPGQIGDPTGRGNACDDANDAIGCIISQNLLVEDASAAEIAAAVAGVDAPAGNDGGADNADDGAADNGNGNDNNGNGNGAAAPPVGGLAGKNQNVGTCQVAGGGGGAAAPPADDGADDGADDEVVDDPEEDNEAEDDVDNEVPENCPAPVTVTVTATAGAPTGTGAATTTAAPVTTAPPAATTPAPPAATGGVAAPVNVGNLDFRDCTDPSIIFAPGLEGRKKTEFSFINFNRQEFPQASALNPDIIYRATCDTFVNRCGFTNADQLVQDCRQAQADATAQFGKSPAGADFFNAALGFKSNFAAIDPNAANALPATDASGKLLFGDCQDPSVKFGAGFEGRAATEFTFLPNNPADFPHGSAKNPDIIYQFTCDQLVNNCGLTNADAVVKLCRQAQADAKPLGFTGASADFFNGKLGFKTNFAALD